MGKSASSRDGRVSPPAEQRAATDETPKSREDVLRDFRKIAGPLRGRNRVRSPKS